MGKGGREMILSDDAKELLSGKSYAATKLAPEDEWIGRLDHEAFRADVAAVGKEFAANQGPEDLRVAASGAVLGARRGGDW